jgi:hypothetical protein
VLKLFLYLCADNGKSVRAVQQDWNYDIAQSNLHTTKAVYDALIIPYVSGPSPVVDWNVVYPQIP